MGVRIYGTSTKYRHTLICEMCDIRSLFFKRMVTLLIYRCLLKFCTGHALPARRRRPSVNRPLVYDWMRGLTFAAALGSLQFLEMSRVYHYIRGQAMVKLYVLIAMVEIFDKASRLVLGV